MSEKIQVTNGNVVAQFKDPHSYNFYLLLTSNWNKYKDIYKDPSFFNFKYDLLGRLEDFMDEVYKDVIVNSSCES